MPAAQRIDSRATFREVLDEAFSHTRTLIEADPAWSLPRNIKKQLEFIRDLTDGDNMPDADERQKPDVGCIAVRNFDDSNPEYSDLLKELNFAFRHYNVLPRFSP